MASTKKYWKDLGELHQVAEVTKGRESEFAQPLPIDEVLGDKKFSGATTDRRDFLKFLGFSLSAATLAACETPVIKSIPYINKPEDITPGVANWYASTFYDGEDYATVLVKTREGRPIHVKGNPRTGINLRPGARVGAVNARINTSVLGLYDSERQKGPSKRAAEGREMTSWSDADAAISKEIRAAQQSGKKVVVLTSTVISPSTKRIIESMARPGGDEAQQAAPSVQHVQCDPISYSGIANANAKCFGKRVMPSYDLTKANVLVSIDADFLSTWGSTTEHTWQYGTRRKPGHMSRHWQFEARMSLSGANADQRVPMKVSELPMAVIALHDHIAGKTGVSSIGGASERALAATAQAANELIAAQGMGLVIAGCNDEGVQTIVNRINWMLGNYGNTIDLNDSSTLYQGDDAAFANLVQDMKAGRVAALLMHGVNPAYNSSMAAEFKEGLAKVGTTVSFSSYADETASLCNWICPDNHYLESWNDLRPRTSHYNIQQPAIRSLFDTRQWQESLMRWSDMEGTYLDMIKRTSSQVTSAGEGLPGENWNSLVANGGAKGPMIITAGSYEFAGDMVAAASAAKKLSEGAGEFELSIYQKTSMGSGQHANNPWLQEMPDPLTKITWDNYICMAPADMERLGMQLYIGEKSPASVAKVSANGYELELPVLPAPGQCLGTVSVAVGYGRGANGERIGRAAATKNDDGGTTPIGKNAFPFASMMNGSVCYNVNSASVSATGGTYPLAITQTHLTAMDRHSVVKETTQSTWAKHDPRHTYNHRHELVVHEDVNGDGVIDARDKKPVTEFDLYTEHPVEGVGHRWGMSIDLNSCIGCGSCLTACQSENNVSVVGKDEVRRSREMHWLRLDRYYSSDMTKDRAKAEGVGDIDMYLDMEVPSDTPKVVFMPVMCQHCNHAPCETVCPVAATTHSNEGLNMMTYNRCIGTRYCANNCPYKVRRFNWFNYVSPKFEGVNPAFDDLSRMVLNPDVVVRARGVIEKCSMCVQRIQEGKLAAKKESEPVQDGAIATACMDGCPTSAITFGDLNDKGSKVRELHNDERAYYMLEEVGVRPNVSYLTKVRNTEEEAAHEEHAHG